LCGFSPPQFASPAKPVGFAYSGWQNRRLPRTLGEINFEYSGNIKQNT